MLPAELGLQSGLWQTLVHKRSPGWTVRELIATCRPLMGDGKLAPYFAPGSENKLRRFVLERPRYFRYDAKEDTVSLADDSASAAVDRWLVRYLALHVRTEDAFLYVESEAFARHMSVAPSCMVDHLVLMYGGSLEAFFKAHPRVFTIDDDIGGVVWVTRSFQSGRNVAAAWKEEALVLFFVDLLQKIGATRDSPCEMHTLIDYLPFMSGEERALLDVGYRGYLNVFFLLYPDHFEIDSQKRYVFLKNSNLHYGEALFLKQQIQIPNRFCSGPSSNMSVVELTLRAKYSTSPVAPLFSGVKSAVDRVMEIVEQHPAIFNEGVRSGKAWLRKESPPWPEGYWNADTEVLAVAYFIEVLQHIGATSPSRSICFNYIIRAARAAPASCSCFLQNVFPALEVIGLFHLHPDIFDLSSVNRVCLKTDQEEPNRGEAASDGAAVESGRDRVEKQAIGYVAKLLKYVRDLDPELLTMCAENAPVDVRNYCMASVESRLQSAIERGKAALYRQEAQLSGTVSPDGLERNTSEAATQTRDELDLRPVACESKKEDEAARGEAKAEGQTACDLKTPANNKGPKKVSVAASLAKAISTREAPVARARPGPAKAKVVLEMTRENGEAPSGDEPVIQPVTCEPEKKHEVPRRSENPEGQRSCGTVTLGSKARKKESVAASLAKTVSSPVIRPLPGFAKSRPVTCEPEEQKAAGDVHSGRAGSRKPRDTAVSGRREAKKESIAACLAGAISAQRLCVPCSQPQKDEATVEAKVSKKGQPQSAPSGPGCKNKGAVLFAVLDRLAAASPKKLDSEARANQSQVSNKSNVDNSKERSAVSMEEPGIAASERECL